MKTKIIYNDNLFIRVEYSNLSVENIKTIFEYIIKNQKQVLNVHFCKGYGNIAHFTIDQMKEFIKLNCGIHKGFNDKFYLSCKYFTLIFDNLIVEYDKNIETSIIYN